MPDDFKDDLDALLASSKKTPALTRAMTKPGNRPPSSMDEYLAIPAVSNSLLCALLDECPFAAWFQSWLNPHRPPERTSDEMDLGTIAHAILLEGDASKIAVIDPNDHPAKTTGAIPNGWTNASIRAARDEARASGLIPLLPGDVGQVNAMVDSGHAFIESLRTAPADDLAPAVWRMFQPDGGKIEQTFTWDDSGTPCRIRADRISNDYRVIANLKTTARSCEPDSWARSQLSGMGYYRADAFYRRGIQALFGVDAAHVFVVVSCEPPYLCSLVGCDPAWQAAGDSEIELALRMWRKCVERNHWPRYPNRVCYPEPPAYLIARYQEREALQQYSGNGLPGYDFVKDGVPL